MLRFLDFLFPPRDDELALRSVTPDEFLRRMNPMLVPVTSPAAIVLLSYADPVVRSAIHEAKYHGSEQALALLASALGEYLREGEDAKLGKVRIVPIPLSRARERERRFNQAHEIAARAANGLGMDVEADLLLRVRDTASQVSLPREMREENMRGAFAAARSADPSCSYILVDDVVTTGATLQAAIDALTQAGAKHIIPLALTH